MRRWMCMLLASGLSASVLLSGCSELADIDQKALVVGFAADVGSSPKTSVAGIQYIVPGSGQGGSGGTTIFGGGGASQTGQGVDVCDEATSLGAALLGLRNETDRYIFFGNLSSVVIGEALARQSVQPALDLLMRDDRVSESVQLAVVRGPACTFLQTTTPASTASALTLFAFMRDAETTTFPVSPNVLWRFMASDYSPAASGYMPLVRVSEQGSPFRVLGVAIFLHDRMVGAVDGYRNTSLDWLIKRGGFPDALVNLAHMPQPVDLRIQGLRRQIKVLSGHRVRLTLRIFAVVRQAPGLILGSRDLSGMENAAAAQIHRQVRDVLNQLQRERADVMGIDDDVLARYPSEAANWPRVFSRMKISLSVDVRILSGGRLA